MLDFKKDNKADYRNNSYKTYYFDLLNVLTNSIIQYYSTRLVSIVLYGSVARNTFRPDSDIDLLIICDNLIKGRTKRLLEFIEYIEKPLKSNLIRLSSEGINPVFCPLLKTKEEVLYGSLLFLDIAEEGKILYDKDNFFSNYLIKFRDTLRKLGTKKVYTDSGYYWLLKPDYKFGEVIEL
ncbi:MAG: nucleotidyltransferase domain-containing protein [Thermodesulfovibrionales bacterium]|nr:nucleotidyltransferase domain-containing protein [Thermodesulfovibrionales bacterium]